MTVWVRISNGAKVFFFTKFNSIITTYTSKDWWSFSVIIWRLFIERMFKVVNKTTNIFPALYFYNNDRYTVGFSSFIYSVTECLTAFNVNSTKCFCLILWLKLLQFSNLSRQQICWTSAPELNPILVIVGFTKGSSNIKNVIGHLIQLLSHHVQPPPPFNPRKHKSEKLINVRISRGKR